MPDLNALDWLLIVVVAAYALSGYWQGFVTGAFATTGLLLGGVFGIWLAPTVLGDASPSLWVSLGALFIVILSASLGQALLQVLGGRIRDRIPWQPVRAVDAVGGAALSAVAVLLVAWALGVAVSGTKLGGITGQVRESAVLQRVDGALPGGADQVLSAFDSVVGTTYFPRYLEPFASERITPVPKGPPRLLGDPDVLAAEDGVFKVRSTNACGNGVEGSGFLYADDRLMTNAHVVAGVEDPVVVVGDTVVPARVVHYDSDLDVAVLAFDDQDAPPLPFDLEVDDGEGVAILGYPEDGPFDVQSARIRSVQRLSSPDIYGAGSVLREVYSLRGPVRPGNSGGPILTSEGSVAGMVFAASVTDAETGYALTASQIAESAAIGITSAMAVDTGACLG